MLVYKGNVVIVGNVDSTYTVCRTQYYHYITAGTGSTAEFRLAGSMSWPEMRHFCVFLQLMSSQRAITIELSKWTLLFLMVEFLGRRQLVEAFLSVL